MEDAGDGSRSFFRRRPGSEAGSASLEYGLIAAAVAMAIGYAVWVAGAGFREALGKVEAALKGDRALITSTIERRGDDVPRPVTNLFGEDVKPRGSVDPAGR